MPQMPLPKWVDLSTYERHKLLGELIDAMIYSGEAVQHLKVTVEQFRLMGYVRSVILPQNEPEDWCKVEDEVDDVCPDCDGKGCDNCTFVKPDEL
jgi:hypothetical protein